MVPASATSRPRSWCSRAGNTRTWWPRSCLMRPVRPPSAGTSLTCRPSPSRQLSARASRRPAAFTLTGGSRVKPLCPERFPLDELLRIRGPPRLLLVECALPAAALTLQWRACSSAAGCADRLSAAIPAATPRWCSPVTSPLRARRPSDFCGFVLDGPAARATRPAPTSPSDQPLPRRLTIWRLRCSGPPATAFGLPDTIAFLLHSLSALERQKLRPNAVLIEDAANGPAVLQTLRRKVPGLLPITPKGSKLMRAHAVRAPAGSRPVGLPSPRRSAAGGAAPLPAGLQGLGRMPLARVPSGSNPVTGAVLASSGSRCRCC